MTNDAEKPKYKDPAPGKPNEELTLDQLHERYLALVPDMPDIETAEGRQQHRNASAEITEDIKRFEDAAAKLRLCRFCTMRQPPTKRTKYCYVTCVPNSPSRFPQRGPDRHPAPSLPEAADAGPGAGRRRSPEQSA